ncbi:MAG: MFS transporter [Candidatus Andeanibacterium colombiense]|uniref:MFS transporter n=1 Tax=Candidatus Andeanibacterium colombiense TaxID=3121345 RepID=A0AAJ5X5I0_9SPHN|nr:MAG: MFS transporter [Sphingomonadaceae bacterium]
MPATFSEAIARRPLGLFQIVTVAVCLLVLMCDGVDMQLLGLVAPVVIRDFGVDKGTFGIAMSAALVGMGIGAWLGGWLGDILGRRRSLALAALIFGLATIAASTSGSVWSMAAWRLIGGLGFGSAFSNALAMGSEWLPKRWQPLAITSLSVGTPAGGAIAGVLAPELLAEHGWRGTFIAFGAATLVLVVIVYTALRDSPSFLLAKGKRNEALQNARRVIRADIELAAEHLDTGSAEGPPVGVLHSSNFRLNAGVGAGFAASTLVAYGILNWSTTILTTKGVSLQLAGYAISVAGITSILGSILAGILVQKFGTKPVMLAVSGILAVTLVALAAAVETMSTASSGGIALVTVLIGIAAAAFSCSIATVYVVITLGYPQSCRSAGIGFGIFTGRIGAILASGFGGVFLEIGGGSTLPFFAILVASAALIFAAALVIDRHVPAA